MLNSADPRSLARARQLTSELRTLQARMNQTIEDLCALVVGQCGEVGEVSREARAEVVFSPPGLHLPESAPVRAVTRNGEEVSAGVALYSDRKGGFLQVLQQPLLQRLDASYGLQVHFAEFDGSWLSLVFNASALLKDMPAGRARVSLSIQLSSTPALPAKLRWTWMWHGQRQERQLDLNANELGGFQTEIEAFDPVHMTDFELHLIVRPPARGTIELRRLSALLSVDEQAGVAEQDSDNVFEAAP